MNTKLYCECETPEIEADDETWYCTNCELELEPHEADIDLLQEEGGDIYE